MSEADLEKIDRYTPASANPEIVKEVADMSGMAQAIYEKGIGIGSENTAKLMSYLASIGRVNDVIRAGNDENLFNQLLAEYKQNTSQT